MVNWSRPSESFATWIKAVLALTAAGAALLWAMQFLSHDLRFAVINDVGYRWRTLTQPYGTLLQGAAAGVVTAAGAWVWRRGRSRAATLLAAGLAAGAAMILVYEIWGSDLNQAASMTRYWLLVNRSHPWMHLLAH
ncbi:hypothetical protein EAH89_02265 [Roseomonas nepalensis]|uniref:Uncharacterized protein n=1 Tax=Muricoccus nepalensis TaxID=1854500 RepID=A0A502GKN3_9PROT|nr:hypothetical protein [Roseomonas nepalensis]TPG61393.1 hypothetical protein EAH89_02265 [Roseomonas nepalensis]